MTVVKYRSFNPLMEPRRTRMDIPGWAGAPEKRVDGSHEQPWHCVPFSEAARQGIELPFGHEHDYAVEVRDGAFTFRTESTEPPPFRSFGTAWYTYKLALDLKVEEGLALKFETHPRFYTDQTGTVPVAVPAVIRHWWPMVYFVVFKAPRPGETHLFRPGEPFLMVTVVEADGQVTLAPMPVEEAAERALQSERIHASRDTLGADTRWLSRTDTVFDGTYRKIHAAAKAVRDA
jgi:hypothetical protein